MLAKKTTVGAKLLSFMPMAFIAVIAMVALGVLRYREQFIPFYCIWGGVGLSDWRRRSLWIIAIYVVVFSLGVSVYIFGKIFR